MPRDGSNIYHYPVGIEGEPNQTIQSAPYNSLLSDIEQDLNLPRPILAGGTGANSADAALAGLGAEKASQIVTNYDSHMFTAGSFSSATSATGSPVVGHAFAGIVYLFDSNNLIVEARDLDDTSIPPRMYIRQKKASVWSAWAPDFDQTAQNTLNDGRYVNVTGDTMSGDLVIAKSAPLIDLRQVAGSGVNIVGRVGTLARWVAVLGDGVAETGDNAGANFTLQSYNDAGVFLANVLAFVRSTSLGTVVGDPTAPLGIATKQYVDLSPKLAGGQNFTGGFSFTAFNNGNMGTGTFTFNPMNGNYQIATNNGAVQIQVPSVDCAMDILIANSASSGALTFAGGFVVNAANVGDALTTINGHHFIVSIRRIGGVPTYVVKALQ